MHATMSSRAARGGGGENGSAKGAGPSKKIIETIRDVTGASDDDISCMLVECNYDVNDTVNRLIDRA